MDNEQIDIANEKAPTLELSSYGLMTAERILGTYNIKLPKDALMQAIKNPSSFYCTLLQVPFEHIRTGIILSQAEAYLIFAKKMFIDYLLSGESGKSIEAPGGVNRESLEMERQKLLSLADDFHQLNVDHDKCIAESQAYLKTFTAKLKKAADQGLGLCQEYLESLGLNFSPDLLQQALNYVLIHDNISSKTWNTTFFEQAQELLGYTLEAEQLRICMQDFADLMELDSGLEEYKLEIKNMVKKALGFRVMFHDIILEAKNMMESLPEYRPNPAQETINKEDLYFDASIGEEME